MTIKINTTDFLVEEGIAKLLESLNAAGYYGDTYDPGSVTRETAEEYADTLYETFKEKLVDAILRDAAAQAEAEAA